jgi:hypothetical protein
VKNYILFKKPAIFQRFIQKQGAGNPNRQKKPPSGWRAVYKKAFICLPGKD